MKKKFIAVISFVLVLSLIIPVSASAKTFNWYCKHEKDGKQPGIDPEMKFIENYGGYYLDRKADENDKVIYLTFDAGYENGNVEKILDTMKTENVKGAFFILDNLIKHDTALVKRMKDEGHLICNHTAKHKDMTKISDLGSFKAELDSLESTYEEYVGGEMAKYYRPPEGKFSEENLKMANDLGYCTIFWSFAYADWDNERQMSPETAVKKILDGTHNGEIILLHPTSATNAQILGELIRAWKDMGYRFGTLDELTGKNA